LRELAASIEENGLIQPLVVRRVGETFELIAGERRLRACEMADVQDVPVVIRDVTDAEAYALALVENIQREDLNPIEEALAYERLMEEFEFTQAELAEDLGKSRSTIANAVRLLGLPEQVREMVAAGKLSAGHARTLVPLTERQAVNLAKRIVRQGLSVRKTEQVVKRLDEEGSEEDEGDDEGESSSRGYRDDAQTRMLTREMQKALGTKVELKDKGGKGRVEIHYDDKEVLQSVLERLGIEV
jgi:ParB family chromosome partitioning protein